MKEKGLGITEDFYVKIQLSKEQREKYQKIKEKMTLFKETYDETVRDLVKVRNKLFELNRILDQMNWFINF